MIFMDLYTCQDITSSNGFPPEFDSVLVRVSIAMKRHHDNSSYTGKKLIEETSSFRGLVHYHHGWT